jgi:hypothetical protein
MELAGIEEVHINLVARVSHAHPKLGRIMPLQPRTPQAKSFSKFLKMKDSQAAKVLSPTNHFPI